MKKIIAVILAIVVSAHIAAPFYAAAPQKVKSLHPEFAGKLFSATLSGEAVSVSSLQSLTVRPGSELIVILAGREPDANLFFDQNGEPVNTADVTVSKMRATGVTAGISAAAGEHLVEIADIGVQNPGTPAAKPVLRVRFTQDFDMLEPEPFELSVYISIGGAKQEQSALRIAGTFGSPEIMVDSAYVGVYAEGSVVVALEDIPYIELQAGYGVTVAASLRQGGRYRVQARAGDDPSDMEAMEKNSALTDVIALDTAGFDGVEISGVRIESAQGVAAYDEDGELLGTTTDARALPFRGKYYLVQSDGIVDSAEITKPLS